MDRTMRCGTCASSPSSSSPTGTRIDSSRSYQTATTANGRFAALTRPYDSNGVAETRVVDLDSGRTVYTTTDSVRAIWGTTVWVMSGNDTVVPYDLLTGKQGEPVWFGRGCLLNDFQAVGRWLLWNCVLNSEGQGVRAHSMPHAQDTPATAAR
ncbi:hypothetical protein [Streptomyces mirabilis]|uniref:hypothetical protein n=1 Tax=Streptomyces mirabilis TaxID=68239 RepID=UPI003325118D